MQFTVKQSDFVEAFGKVYPAVPAKSTLPILSNVLLQLEGNTLKIVATDLEVSVLAEIEVQGKDDGIISVPAKKINDIMRELEGMDVTCATDESLRFAISAGDGNYQVPGVSAQEFPSLPEFAGAAEFTMDAQKLSSIIQRTQFAVSRDELRPALTGVFFQIRSREISAVSTDGHRLVRIIDHDFQFDGEQQELIIPVKALVMIQKNLSDKGEVKIGIGSNQIMVNLENTVIYSRLIEGKYPHYESVIPQNNTEKLVVSCDALMKVVKRVMIFANPISHQVVFKIGKESLEISAEDIELGGQGREKVAATYDGEEKTIGYNAVYVLELLRQIHTEEVLFLLGGETQAGIVKPVEKNESEDFIMLIMPVRLN